LLNVAVFSCDVVVAGHDEPGARAFEAIVADVDATAVQVEPLVDT
jgi:hypothetical protein